MNEGKVTKYCFKCQSEIELEAPVKVTIGDDEYYPYLECYYCKSNLSISDEKAIQEAKEKGIKFALIVYK